MSNFTLSPASSPSHLSLRTTGSDSSRRSRRNPLLEELAYQTQLEIGRGPAISFTQRDLSTVLERVYHEVITAGTLTLNPRPDRSSARSCAAYIYRAFHGTPPLIDFQVLGLLVTLALQHVLRVESGQIPSPVPVPGVRQPAARQAFAYPLQHMAAEEHRIAAVLEFIVDQLSTVRPEFGSDGGSDFCSRTGSDRSRAGHFSSPLGSPGSYASLNMSIRSRSDDDLETATARLQRLGYPWARSGRTAGAPGSR